MFKSFTRNYTADRLERDTRSIIQSDEIGRKPHHLQKIAELIAEYIAMSNQETPIKDNSLLNTSKIKDLEDSLINSTLLDNNDIFSIHLLKLTLL